MTPLEYRTALATLGLSQLAAGRWLGVSNKTAQRYATTGPSGAAARAVGLAVALTQAERWDRTDVRMTRAYAGSWLSRSDVSAAIDLPAK